MALQPDTSAGVNTGSKLFILFMIVFLMLNYSVFLSICLGAIAGLTGGFTAAWWNAKEDYLTEAETAQKEGVEEQEMEESTVAFPQRGRKSFGVRPAHKARRGQTGNWKSISLTIFPRKKKNR